MPTLLLILSFAVLMSSPVAAQSQAPVHAANASRGPGSRCGVPGLRPMHAWVASVLDQFVTRSSTLQRLVADVAASSSIVHIGSEPGAPEWDGRFRFVTMAGGCRYVRVDLRRFPATPERTAAVLAHELQHVLEADRGAVVDQLSLGRLFQRIGFWSSSAQPDTFDTLAAVAAGLQALHELTGRPVAVPTGTAQALSFRGLHTAPRLTGGQ